MFERMLKTLLALFLALFPVSPPSTGGGQTAPPTFPRDQVVLQVAHGGGFRMIDRASDEIPDVTIWGDGRVVFAAPDRTVREGRLAPAVVDRLVRQATFLYDLQDQYMAAYHTDDATATFTVLTDKGRKTVSVYALNPTEPQEDEPHPAIFAQLRQFWAAVHAALPADAPEFKPTDVRVITLQSDGTATAEWPATLTGRLTGEKATQAVELAGLREAKLFLLDGKVHLILVVPVLPQPGAWAESH